MSIRFALLGLLAHQPRHGYELHARLQALVGGPENWDLKPAQVYNTLARLATAGLITEEAVGKEGGPEKRIFALTPQGRLALRTWLESYPEVSEPLGDESFLKLMLAIITEEALARRVIQNYRVALYRELHRVTTQRTHIDPRRKLALILLMDRRIMHLEANLRWLDMVEARLDDIARQPLPQPTPRPRGRPARKLPPFFGQERES
jgi:DNA-binding PadR family transcriptional regulator